MLTTKEEYIQMHPCSKLASNLLANDWPVHQKIEIVKGTEVTEQEHKKSNGSNLFHSLQRNNSTEYEKGAKLGISDGRENFIFAVRIGNEFS